MEMRDLEKISQAELGRRAGLTRQAVNLIERGKVVPSVATALALADALGCTVADIFQRQRGPEELELSLHGSGPVPSEGRVHVANVRDRWIGIPALDACSGDVEGFGRTDGILIPGNGRSRRATPSAPEETLRKNLVLAGCDPAIGILRDLWNGAGDGRLLWLNLPTAASVKALVSGQAHVAGVHFPDAAAERKTLAMLPMAVKVVRFADWEQGWMVRRGNPTGFSGAADLADRATRLMNRPAGSGSRLLLDGLVRQAGLKAADIPFYRNEGATHFSCARAVARDQADVALGLRAVAAAGNLDFLPVQEVSFNFLVPMDLLSTPPVARLLDLLHGRALHRQLADLPGYETRGTGTTI